MRFKLASNGGVSCCEWIAAEGEITKQTPNDFEAFLNEWKTWGGLDGHTIRFNSPGGALIAGVQLGELFRSGRFSTEVGSNQALPPLALTHPYEKTRVCGMSTCARAFSRRHQRQRQCRRNRLPPILLGVARQRYVRAISSGQHE